MKYYALVVDTDQYAGNFEREMASYCTGLEFPRGAEYITDEVENAEWWEDNTYDDGEEGCSIWTTPGWFNNGMGWHYEDTPENRELAVVKSRDSMIAYHATQKSVMEERLRNQNFDGTWTQDACERTLESIKASIANTELTVTWPANMSVAMFSSEQPPAEVIDEVWKRAQQFNTVYQQHNRGLRKDTPITVKKIRLVMIETVVTKTEINVGQ